MIRAEYDRSQLRLCVKGHARYAERGKDIVCAGASVLYHTAIAALEAESRNGGRIICDETGIRYEGGDKERVGLIMDTIWRGFQMLAEGYGDYITAEKTG